MKELIEKMIWLLEEYKDKCCGDCNEGHSDDSCSGKSKIIYKRYNHATLEPFTDYRWCSLWIYEKVKDNNWFWVNGEWYCAAIPSWGWLTILRCKQCYNVDSEEYEWHNEILFHFTKDELKELSRDL